MEEIIKQLNEFIDIYVDGTKIKSIIYEDDKWTIKYSHDVDDDVFDNPKDMVEFLEADRYGV